MSAKKFLLIICLLMRIVAAEGQNAEKIILITDKQWYYPGESLWFSLRVFDACADTLSDASKIVYVELIGSDNRPMQQMKVAVSDAHGEGAFTIGENITTGRYAVIAYTNRMKNFGAQSYSRATIQVVNPVKQASLNTAETETSATSTSEAKFKVEVAKKVFEKRERIPVKISNTSSSGVIVSVFRIDALQRGAVPFNEVTPAGPCKIEGPVRFITEDRGDIISGRVIDKRSQQPAAGIRGYLSVVDAPNELFVATSDSVGAIKFDVGDLRGKRELVLQTNSDIDSNYSIELSQEFTDPPAALSDSGKKNVFETAPDAVNGGIVSAQVQQYFYGHQKIMEDTLPNPDVPFYGKPDAFYLMSDYVRFSTVEEIFREYITLVGIQIRKRHLVPVVYDVDADRKPFTGSPLVLVNGVPTFNPDRLMAMNADDFYSIAVIGRKYFFGHQMFYGLIDIRLNRALTDFGKNVTVVDYSGASNSESFNSPNYSNESKRSDRKPDFRNVLYWNPDLEKDRDGNYTFDFYSSDLGGEYAIVVRAVSDKGKVETSQTLIQVK
jgi:hypothetical protein